MKIISWGDPSGMNRTNTDATTCYQILSEEGIRSEPCYTNSSVARIEAVKFFLNKMNNGEPGLLVGSKCPVIRKGFLGRYCYKRITSSNIKGLDYGGEPLKDYYSHSADAVQYIAASLLHNDVGNQACKVIEDGRYPGVGNDRNDSRQLDLSVDMKGYF